MRFELDDMLIRTPMTFDAKKTLKYYTDNQDRLERWQSKFSENFLTLESQVDTILYERKLYKEDSEMVFYAFKDGQIAARCHIYGILRGDLGFCMMSYSVDRNYEGKSVAFKFVSFILELLGSLNLRRCFLLIDPENIRSRNFALRLGFEEAGIEKDIAVLDGNEVDLIRYVKRLN